MRASPNKNERRLRAFTLAFGPQHPAAHGILRVNLLMAGEIIYRGDLGVGLLHRGSEKLCEGRTTLQALPYLDRMDYVANLFQEHALVRALEPVARPQPARVLCDELSRVLNHLLTLSAVCLDLGAMGPIFWAFEEREHIMEALERASGARMHTALYRANESTQLPSAALSCVALLTLRGARVLNTAFLGLLGNRALRSRLAGVGVLARGKLGSYGVSGVLARAAGLRLDARLGAGAPAYASYRALSLVSPLGRRGDNYDRFVLRAREVLESYRLVAQAASWLTAPRVGNQATRPADMASLITHFRASHQTAGRGLGLGLSEGPKG
jgi:NADH-quinone oxidoreductase subunit D